MKQNILFTCALLASVSSADTLKPATWVPLPAIGSSPETGLQYGVYVMHIFAQSAPNQLQNRLEAVLQGTSKGQYRAYLFPNFFFDDSKWNLRGKFGGRYWPNGYFGEQNDAGTDFDYYANTLAEGSIAVNYLVAPAIRVGLSTYLENHQITDIQDPSGSESDLLQTHITGAQGGFYSGMGAEIIIDHRDNIDWPSQGQLVSLQWDAFSSVFGSDLDFDIIHFSAAQYVPLADAVFAFSSQMSVASEDTPFTHLPRPTGDSALRGANGNRWINNTGLGLQSEYRKPLSNKWAAVGFVDTFQVSEEIVNLKLSQFHYSVGAGIRYAMTPDRFNIRFDIGYVDLESVNFAFSIGEAF